MKIESLIRDFLDENCPSSSPRFDVFMRMYREGLLLLLFDGFDEMAIRMDASDVDANLTEIEKLSGIVGNVILTCRPEFFISSKEEKSAWRPLEDHLTERLSTYQQVEIELWSSEQVTHYIKKRICKLKPPSPNPAQYYIDRIQQMSELRDMSVRAVHLDLIVKLLPTIIERKIQITRINLYKTHILRELRRETVTNKRLKVISDEDRLALMQIVAADQFLKSNDELNFDAAQKLIIERLKIPKSEAASVTRDFLNRSFLSRKGDIYEFAHKSLGEFLFAAELYNQVSLGDIEFIKAHFYSSPIAGMFLEHFGGVQAFDDMLNALNVHNLRKKSIGLDDIPKVLLVASCINDYSDEVRSLIRQRESAKELDLSCERIDALVYDIKNKLTTLMGCAQLFMKEVGSDHHKIKSISKKAKAYLQTVLKEWDATLQLFDLLRVVRVERLQLKVDLKQTKVDIIRLLKSAFKNIPTNKLIVNGACRPHWGNPIFLARVFENLAHNVKYAIKNRGILTIDVSESKEKRGIEVLLTNTGPQIPAEIIDKIFNYGFTTRADGQGIGLAIAKDMIKLHNGTIKVRSNSK
jgi:signal transduction histidine kinase